MGNLPCCSENEHPTPLQPNRNTKSQTTPTPQLPRLLLTEKTDNETPSQPSDNEPQQKNKEGREGAGAEGVGTGREEAKAAVREGRQVQKLYQYKKLLGKGLFGCVMLVEEKRTGRLFAMKIIEKSKISEYNVMQSELIRKLGHHEFLVQIRETFLFEGKIYIVMEHLPKGDLYFYLRKKEVSFSEADIQNIAAEIVVGLDILHRHGIVYRELKPENIMVTEQGHIKLTDYGLSKLIDNKNSISTFIGTLEYMAPQALNGEFGKKADVWALGILMFELMFRDNPLENDEKRLHCSSNDYEQSLERNNISKNINGRIGYMSLSFRDLLIKLLERNPDKRIGLQEIRAHDFFKEIDWGKVEKRENQPPLKELIQKHDYIKLRDPNTQVCVRRQVIKRKTLANDYQLKLYEFRNSQ